MVQRRWPVIDGDGHIIEDPDGIADCLEAPYTGRRSVLGLFPSLDGRPRRKRGTMAPTTVAEWQAFLEQTGIEQAVIYPTAALTIGLVQDPEWAAIVCRAYNTWLARTYTQADSRLTAVALLPSQNVPAAAGELRRAVSKLGMVGGLLPSVTYFKPLLGEAQFDPLYEAAQALDVGLAIHGGPQAGLGLEHISRQIEAHTLAHPFPLMAQFNSMVFNGVFDRFPRLRVAYLEAGSGWLPYLMDRMDYEAEARAEEWPHAASPSEMIRRGNVFVSCEAEERALPTVVEALGADHVLYASDFPHELGTGPEAYLEDLHDLETRPDLSDAAKEQILGGTAARFYQRVPAPV
jgi:uncharacterized protein